MKQKWQHSQMLMLPTNVNPVYISELSETNTIFQLKTYIFIFTNKGAAHFIGQPLSVLLELHSNVYVNFCFRVFVGNIIVNTFYTIPEEQEMFPFYRYDTYYCVFPCVR